MNSSFLEFKQFLINEDVLKSNYNQAKNKFSFPVFLSYFLEFLENYLEEVSSNSYLSIKTYYPAYLSKKINIPHEKTLQIQEFSQNFILSIQQYADTSREIKFLFEMFFLNDNPNIHKLSFYLKNRKILSNYIYFVKSHTVVLDEVDLSMSQWSTLINRFFGDFRNISLIMKQISQYIKNEIGINRPSNKKTSINAITFLIHCLDVKDSISTSPRKKIDINLIKNKKSKIDYPRKTKKSTIPEENEKITVSPPDKYYHELMNNVDENHKEWIIGIENKEDIWDNQKMKMFVQKEGSQNRVLSLILKIVVECDKLLKDYSKIIDFINQLKEYSEKIKKDKNLSERIINFSTNPIDIPGINKKLSFSKHFISEILNTLDTHAATSKFSLQDIGLMEKSLFSPNYESHDLSEQSFEPLDQPQNNKKTSNLKTKDVQNDKNEKIVYKNIVDDYLKTLEDNYISISSSDVEKKDKEEIIDEPNNENNSENLNFNDVQQKIAPKLSKISEISEEMSFSSPKPGVNQRFTIKLTDSDNAETVLVDSLIKENMIPEENDILEAEMERQSKKSLEKLMEKLKKDGENEGKIQNIIDIKDEDLEFLQRKISQELTQRKHSLHRKTVEIAPGKTPNISRFKKNEKDLTKSLD